MFSAISIEITQPVAEVLESLHVQRLSKTLPQQLWATGGRGWGDTTLCDVNWGKKKSQLECLISFLSYFWSLRISLRC